MTGTSLRSATDVDFPGLLAALIAQADAASGLPLLRVLWYDAGTRQGGPSTDQRAIGVLPRTKLRPGRVGVSGDQKGVDLKLALDLITLSRNRAAEVMYLVSGDDDLSEAVEEAQQQGVQVISLVVADTDGRPIAVSQNLQLTVDQMLHIDEATITTHIKRSAASAMRSVAEAGTESAVPEPATTEAPAVDAPTAPTC